MFSSDPNLPNYRRPEVGLYESDLELIHDLIGGTRVMHAKANKYIKKWKDEDRSIYNHRKTIEEVFEGLPRTLSAAVGMVFAKPPQVTWNKAEATLRPLYDNIDGEGTAWHVFAKQFTERALRDGLGVLLTDHPAPPKDPETGEPVLIHGGNEVELNMRSHWTAYPRGSVMNWDHAVINNQRVLAFLALYEPAEESEGLYGVKLVHKYRHLRIVDGEATWTLFKHVEVDGKDTFPPEATGTFRNSAGEAADFLPVSIAYAGRKVDPLVADIPFSGVAYANLGHLRQSTNLRFYREVAAFPQPTVTGRLQSQMAGGKTIAGSLKVGPMVVVTLEQGGTFAYTELEGKSLDQIEKGVTEKLKQMAQMGVSFLFGDKRAAETAEAKRLDATAENATLSTAAQGIEDALNLASEHFCWFMGIEKADAPVIQLSRDFEGIEMTPDEMRAWGELFEKGMPAWVMLEKMQQGGKIGPDKDIEAIQDEMMVKAKAAEDQKILEEEERARMLAEGRPPMPPAREAA